MLILFNEFRLLALLFGQSEESNLAGSGFLSWGTVVGFK
jgi:hypothetical protein